MDAVHIFFIRGLVLYENVASQYRAKSKVQRSDKRREISSRISELGIEKVATRRPCLSPLFREFGSGMIDPLDGEKFEGR